MAEKATAPSHSRQPEMVFAGLTRLSTLPAVGRQVISELMQAESLSSSLRWIISSEPSLAAAVLSAMGRQGMGFGNAEPSVQRALQVLPFASIRSLLFEHPVLELFEHGSEQAEQRKQLIIHSIAVACCAERLARLAGTVDAQAAYTAGLLHDLGKLAMDERMPRSLARIMEQAEQRNCSTTVVETEQLGVDHAVLGRQLAARWRLPRAVSKAIWLHHSDLAALGEVLPDTRLARIVQSADAIARRCGTGRSGSFDEPASTKQIAEALAIDRAAVEKLSGELVAITAEKSGVLALDLPYAGAAYCRSIREAVSQLAQQKEHLRGENRQLQAAATHLDFLVGWQSAVCPESLPIEVAEDLAVRWQRFYQTGRVCLYLIPPDRADKLQAVLVETLGRSRTLYLDAPDDWPPVPDAAGQDFEVIDAGQIDWLWRQLESDFDIASAKLVPLAAAGRVAAAVVFEQRYPVDTNVLKENLRMISAAAAALIQCTYACRQQQTLAERLVALVSRAGPPASPTAIPEKGARRPAVEARIKDLAELAGGAAHELNNPLSVISGRAQLLGQTETDQQKKRMLRQIQDNAGRVRSIIEDLMAYAEPQQPRPTATDIGRMLNEAVALAAQKAGVEHINAQIKIADGLPSVVVDSGQITSAIANIICNALEAYVDNTGPVEIKARAGADGSVDIIVSDLGCGMDAETVAKATTPFFSARPAGRKRGMGLAHARRLVELNGGSLTIESQPGSGTSVTVSLARE